VTLTVSSTTPANYTYTTGVVSAAGPASLTGSTATTNTLTVTPLSAPTIAAAFSPTTMADGGSSTLTLTITNPNASIQLTGVAVAASPLPANLNGSGQATTCSSGIASFSGGNLSLSGATIASSGSCTVTLTLTSTTLSTYTYTTGAVSATGPSSVSGTTATTPTGLTVNAVPVPAVVSVNPNTGPTTGGTAVVISGSNFTGAFAVKFGNSSATSFAVIGSTQISAIAPAGSLGSVNVTVITPAGPSATSSADLFTYTVPADSVRLRALQLEATKLIAQNSGQAISGAIDDAVTEGFSDNGVFIMPGQTGLRFNFAADPVDPDEQPAPSRRDANQGAANAYGAGAATGDGTAGSVRARARGNRIDDAFNAIDQQMPKKAPPKQFREENDWLFWVDVRGSGINRWASSTSAAGTATVTQSQLTGLQVNALAGLTYKVTPNFLVGAVGGYETFNFTEQDINGKLTGDGWTAGAYLGWKILPTLRYDAAVAYSGINYNGTAGTAQGNFTGERWLAQTGLTGTYKAWGIVVEPSVKVYALWEHEGAYVDSLGTLQGNYDFATGRASAGTKMIYPFAWADKDILFAPYVGLYGDYYFTEDNAAAILAAGGVPLASEPLLQGWSARMVAGIGAKFANGGTIGVGAEYGGIGANFQSWTLKAKAQVPFGAQ
jgi:hypothetical protein